MKILSVLGVVAVLTFPLNVMAQDDSTVMARKLELAKEYSKHVSVAEEIQKSIDSIAVQVPMENRVLLKSTLERHIKTDQLKSISEIALADVFTEAELKAMVDFYSKPEGQSVKAKMPEYQAKLEPVINQMISAAIEAYDRQTK